MKCAECFQFVSTRFVLEKIKLMPIQKNTQSDIDKLTKINTIFKQ